MTPNVASDSTALQDGVEVWRGGVNTWECDEMGHMNVRFYVARCMEGLIGLAAELGMPDAFSPDAGSTLRLRDLHIRFLREVRPPNPLCMIGGVIEMGETDARLLLTLVHAHTGEPAASFNALVSHVTPREGRAFPWTRAVRERVERLRTAVPTYAQPRGIRLDPVSITPTLETAEALGMLTIAVGALTAPDCDVFGNMASEGFIGRIAGGVGRALRAAEDPASSAARVGVAALEYRLVYIEAPRAGDRLVIRSGLVSVDRNALRVAHWMLDPTSGKVWGLAEAVTASFDLDARKIIPISDAARTTLSEQLIPGAALSP
jgi:acyl-CoA thioester hydrolase